MDVVNTLYLFIVLLESMMVTYFFKSVFIHTNQTIFFFLMQKETGSTVQEVAGKKRQITVVQIITVSLNYTYKQVLSVRTSDHSINP